MNALLIGIGIALGITLWPIVIPGFLLGLLLLGIQENQRQQGAQQQQQTHRKN